MRDLADVGVLAVVTVVASVLYVVHADEGAKIVGGEAAAEGEFPFYVGFAHSASGTAFCGGTLVNESTILAAAHCPIQTTDVVIVGGYNLSEGDEDERVAIADVVRHPKYNWYTLQNDIALVFLQHPVTTVSQFATPVFATSNPATYLADGAMCTTVGWGQTETGSPPNPLVLQKVDLPLVANADCAAGTSFLFYADSMLCAGYDDEEKSACYGDSGGPLLNTAEPSVVVAVESWVASTACDGLTYFVRLTDFASWINQYLPADNDDTECTTCVGNSALLSGDGCFQGSSQHGFLDKCAVCVGSQSTECVRCDADDFAIDAESDTCVGACQPVDSLSSDQLSNALSCAYTHECGATCLGGPEYNCERCLAYHGVAFGDQCFQDAPEGDAADASCSVCGFRSDGAFDVSGADKCIVCSGENMFPAFSSATCTGQCVPYSELPADNAQIAANCFAQLDCDACDLCPTRSLTLTPGDEPTPWEGSTIKIASCDNTPLSFAFPTTGATQAMCLGTHEFGDGFTVEVFGGPDYSDTEWTLELPNGHVISGSAPATTSYNCASPCGAGETELLAYAFDSAGDGWDGNTLAIVECDGTTHQITLGFHTYAHVRSVCVAEGPLYFTSGGDASPDEVTWEVTRAENGATLASGGGNDSARTGACDEDPDSASGLGGGLWVWALVAGDLLRHGG